MNAYSYLEVSDLRVHGSGHANGSQAGHQLRHLLNAQPNHHVADEEEKSPGCNTKVFGSPGIPFFGLVRSHLDFFVELDAVVLALMVVWRYLLCRSDGCTSLGPSN